MKCLKERKDDNIKIDVKGIGCDGIKFRMRNAIRRLKEDVDG
jgi:hypothetical protein